MQAIPVKIKNVSVYPYFQNWPGIGPVIEPVITGAHGTYGVGTLGTWVYYNMDLSGGTQKSPLQKGGKYIAHGELEDGTSLETHWMHCLTTGDKPTFGLTKNMMTGYTMGGSLEAESKEEDPYFVISEVVNVSAVHYSSPITPLAMHIISNGKGQMIGTRYGTPHVTGFRITSGFVGPIYPGEFPITLTAIDLNSGSMVSSSNLEVVSQKGFNPPEEAVLLPKFP